MLSVLINVARYGALVVGLVGLITGCATRPVAVPAELPATAQIRDTVFYPQTSDQCGPESLATLLNFSGQSVTPEALSPLVYLPARRGTLAVELVAQARRHGRLVYPLEADLAHVLAEVAAGRPVMILQNLGFGWWPQWHFAVVVGYDLHRRVAFLHSGSNPRHAVDLDLLARTWRRADSWAVVVLRDGNLPATARPERYLQAAADLEETGQSAAALAAFTGASKAWPQNPLAWFGLGNNAYALGDHAAALEAYQTVLRLQPRNVSAWNNLAYTFLELGCNAAARESVSCALNLAPENESLRATAGDIRSQPEGPGEQCQVPSCPTN